MRQHQIPRSCGNCGTTDGVRQMQKRYSGGLFDIDIEIPAEYPHARVDPSGKDVCYFCPARYNPPKMKFDTKIWHPNISSQALAQELAVTLVV